MWSLLYSLPLPVTVTVLTTLAATVALYVHSLFEACLDVPQLHYMDSALGRYIIKTTKRLSQPYRLPSWARSGHTQTIILSFLRLTVFQFEREFLRMKDKGIVALDWGITDISTLNKSSPVLFVLPGLTGDASGLTFLCRLAVRKGFRTVVFNKRGHGHTPLATPKMQSFGDPSDFRQVVKYVRGKFPGARLFGVGTSAGSALLTAYLGEYGKSSHISAVACISPGYDAEALWAHHLKQPYNYLMAHMLKRLVSPHSNTLKQVVDMDKVMRSSTLQQFEENLYCKMYGYSNMSQYWGMNNPMRYIETVTIPILCISSTDDPVCRREIVPIDLFTMYPNTMLVTTKYGGHCGFLEHKSLESWADKVAIDYLSALLDFTDKDTIGRGDR